MILQLGPDERINTDEYSIETLEGLLATITQKHDEIVADLETAKVRYRATGESADPDWFHRVTTARRKTGNAKTQLMGEIARRKKTARMNANFQSDLPRHFIAVAKRMLSDAVYNQILEEATRRYQDSQAGVRENVNYVFEVGE